jgi:hypothetical protein
VGSIRWQIPRWIEARAGVVFVLVEIEVLRDVLLQVLLRRLLRLSFERIASFATLVVHAVLLALSGLET